jgi:hypothetical protein
VRLRVFTAPIARSTASRPPSTPSAASRGAISGNSSSGVDADEREQLHHLVARHDLAVAAGAPAEQGEEVAHRGGEDAEVLIVTDGGRAVALGELLPVHAVDHGDVAEHRRFVSQRAV